MKSLYLADTSNVRLTIFRFDVVIYINKFLAQKIVECIFQDNVGIRHLYFHETTQH